MVILKKQKYITPNKALCYYSGTSNDTKPVSDTIVENSIYSELDTGKVYYFTGAGWSEIPLSGSAADLEFAEGNAF